MGMERGRNVESDRVVGEGDICWVLDFLDSEDKSFWGLGKG